MKKKRKGRDAVREADLDLDRVLKTEVAIIYSSAAIALARYWGWGKKRITALADLTQVVWHECAQTNLKSMPQMLEEETGVEIQCGDGRSWHDLAFLNADIDFGKMNVMQFLYMRQQQMRWITPNVTACILLSLYRKCGFGGDKRLPRIASQIMAVQEEFGWQEDAIRAACRNEAGICVIDYLDSKEIEVEVNEA